MDKRESLTRRRFLKTGAAGLGVATLSGVSAAARYDIPISVVGTEQFHDNVRYSNFKLYDIQQYCQDVWDQDIDNGDYSASFKSYSNWDVSIPESAFQSNELGDRREDAEGWLYSNFNTYSEDWVIVVVDYTAGNDEGVGYSSPRGAYCDWDRCVIVDAYQEYRPDPPEWIEGFDGTGAAAAHEILHQFAVGHGMADTGWGEATLMWSPQRYDGTPEIKKEYSQESIDQTRSFIEIIDEYGCRQTSSGGGEVN